MKYDHQLEWTAYAILEVVKVLLAHDVAPTTITAVIERFDTMNEEARRTTEELHELHVDMRKFVGVGDS